MHAFDKGLTGTKENLFNGVYFLAGSRRDFFDAIVSVIAESNASTLMLREFLKTLTK